ncbi:hypothetical protein [Desulfococcus multivorans]|uniref:Uncharacterized protein n=1 Tax=Desulfococcus multivorans DSM 2059 TaxID=1121405 RepID=S7UFB5_DESML|nr:hypothetical protein [Desulfococcus multivorans]AQV02574.1 hypothetical protein B2D07_18545 [Desulfococcus multivorans]EPR32499.1 hypothetical protein dsmv_0872 [Desulfococcus multivorans DSM 2059]SKA27751.1 hypothetical protein SAMN02745446_03727 [Desulfococcus multivorans DSM 2059]
MYKYSCRPRHIDDLRRFSATKIGPAWHYRAYDPLDGDILLRVSKEKFERVVIHDWTFRMGSDPEKISSYITFHNDSYPVWRAKSALDDHLPVFEIFEVADPEKHYYDNDWTIWTYPDGTQKKVRQMNHFKYRFYYGL